MHVNRLLMHPFPSRRKLVWLAFSLYWLANHKLEKCLHAFLFIPLKNIDSSGGTRITFPTLLYLTASICFLGEVFIIDLYCLELFPSFSPFNKVLRSWLSVKMHTFRKRAGELKRQANSQRDFNGYKPSWDSMFTSTPEGQLLGAEHIIWKGFMPGLWTSWKQMPGYCRKWIWDIVNVWSDLAELHFCSDLAYSPILLGCPAC